MAALEPTIYVYTSFSQSSGDGMECQHFQQILNLRCRTVKYYKKEIDMRLPGVEPGSIAWKAIILTVGLQTLGAQKKNKVLLVKTFERKFKGRPNII
ncbi:hypothetical protein GQ457_08G020780 [Hibiscus cannabinus]